MADVYLARDQLLDRPVALKVLFPELSIDPSFVERFRREAQNAARLNHPNIVSVYDWGEEQNTYFIVMEYIDGQTLSSILKQDGPLSPRSAASVGAEIAGALAFAHRNGVVHRDVKPGNVIIDNRGLAKVTDFGIARARNSSENLTQTGAVMGTATYFSPEQAQGHGVDQRSDVYSLGVVLYELVAGRPPFQGENPVAIAYKHVRETPPELQSFRPDVPDDFANIVARSMAKTTQHRYQTADELRNDLLRFLNNQTVSAPPTSALTQAQATAAYADATQAIPRTEAQYNANGAKKKEKGVLTPLLITLGLLALLLLGGFFLWKNITSSNANTPIDVPSVIGKSYEDAKTELTAAGFRVSQTTEKSEEKDVDKVIRQNPAAGTKQSKESNITLTVGAGPDQVQLGSYIGQRGSNAEAAIRELGLKPQSTRQSSNDVPEGNVISQDPASRAVPEGSVVNLVISSGPKLVTIPMNLRTRTVTDVNNTLSSLGLKLELPSNAQPEDYVSATDPEGGTQVAEGSTVKILVYESTTTYAPTTIPPRNSSTTSSTSTTAPSRRNNND